MKVRQADWQEERLRLVEELGVLKEAEKELKSRVVNVSSNVDAQIKESIERIRGKDLVIDLQTTDMKQLKSQLSSQETQTAYYKKKNEELVLQIEILQTE